MHYANGAFIRCEGVLSFDFPSCSYLNTTAFLTRMIQYEQPYFIVLLYLSSFNRPNIHLEYNFKVNAKKNPIYEDKKWSLQNFVGLIHPRGKIKHSSFQDTICSALPLILEEMKEGNLRKRGIGLEEVFKP